MEYVLVLADIIKANDPDRTRKDAYRSARHKYESGKYKSACLCISERPEPSRVCQGPNKVRLHEIRPNFCVWCRSKNP